MKDINCMYPLERKTLEKVTKWSAETSDGVWYAESYNPNGGGEWRLYKHRGKGSGLIKVYPPFKKMKAEFDENYND